MKRLICLVFGHTWKHKKTHNLGRDLKLRYTCRRCPEMSDVIMSDGLEDEAAL